MVIPLDLHPETGQIGINVKLGKNPHPLSYLLDTGSFGFFTAMGGTHFWDGSLSSRSSTTFSASYGNGTLSYSGRIAHTDLTFTDLSGNPLLIRKVRMGIITNQPYPHWDAEVNRMPRPIAPENSRSHLFFGTMGAGLSKVNGGDVTSVIGQIPLPAGLKKGFVIHTGGPHSKLATLSIGLTPEMITSFPIIIPMNASTGVSRNDNGTTMNLYPEAQTTATYRVIGNNQSPYATTADLIMDTGGLGTHFTKGRDVKIPDVMVSNGVVAPGGSVVTTVSGAIVPGTSLLAQSLDWAIDPTGTTEFVDQVKVMAGSNNGSLNTGIALFYTYDVMFDTADGVIGLCPMLTPISPLVSIVRKHANVGNGGACQLSVSAWSPSGIQSVVCQNRSLVPMQTLHRGPSGGVFTIQLRLGVNRIRVIVEDRTGHITRREIRLKRAG
ncbi:MAG TPA: hypothetical protein VIM48_00630 [Chthoniobacterales bacterium]